MTDTPHPPDPDDRRTDAVGPAEDGRAATEAAGEPRLPTENRVDDPLDPTEQAVRDLLRHDEVGVDPAQRDRAVFAALAVADEVLPDAGSADGEARPVTPADVPLEVPHHPSTVVPLPSRPRPGLRVLAVAAAIVLVGAGAVVVGGGGSSNDESTAMNDSSGQDSSSPALQDSAESAPSGGGAADSSATADGDAAERQEQEAPSPTTTAQGPTSAAEPALPPGVVVLGPRPDIASVLRAAVALTTGDAPSTTSAPANAQLPPCPGVLDDLAAQPLAVATIGDAPVLVVRAVDPGTVPLLTVLALPDCAVLGRG